MKYLIVTYGCQMNEHDSEQIAFILEDMGYERTEDRDEADLIVYNTCLIRENAELKVYGQIGSLKGWREEREDRILILCGCMMQTGPAKDLILEKYPQVDIIFGTGNIQRLRELIAMHQQTGQVIVDVTKYQDDWNYNYERENHYSAYVNIMTGCNNFCTYCIVPYARGREESRPMESILEECRDLAQRGYKEITLLGQNVNSYGKTIGVTFPDLLREINKIDGIDRIRFMTSHPKDLSDDLILAMKECEKVPKTIHLPLQSGSTRILKAMNRKYTREDYLLLVKKLREAMPDITITTDIIVGFPGETEEDHEETLSLCREVRYDSAFTFLFSPRPGTPAAKMENVVPKEVADRRFQKLLDTLYPIFYEKNEEYLGKTLQVLVESVSKNDKSKMSGRSAENKLVHFKGTEELIGKIVDVKINSHTSFTLEGEMVE